jgi:hypothetical protein
MAPERRSNSSGETSKASQPPPLAGTLIFSRCLALPDPHEHQLRFARPEDKLSNMWERRPECRVAQPGLIMHRLWKRKSRRA